MQALYTIEPMQRPQASYWTEEEKREVRETVLFWLEEPDPSEVMIDFLQNRAIRIHYEGLAELHWEEVTYRRFGMMLQKSGVRRVWFG